MKQIHQFIIKNVNGQKRKVGVLVGRIDESGTVRIGWSRANINRGDKFNKKYGMELASERTNAEECVPVPPSIVEDAYDFQDRCGRYFKDATAMYKIAIQRSVQKETV